MEELRLAEEQQREINRRQEEESRKTQKLAQSRLDMDTNVTLVLNLYIYFCIDTTARSSSNTLIFPTKQYN